ncbi:MAG TPA: hypothetical protein VHS30_03445 [Streptosporangiaceae bacterium]|nr:hypothetical protein [Streptosporangiaceae bacterium]
MDIGLTDQASARRVSAGRSLFREHMLRFTRWSRRHPRLAWVTAAAVVCLVLFWCYLRQAQTYQLNTDPAGQALQAWDMLHGNLLLRGWWLGDVSFYTVELPLNMIIEMIVGLRPVEISILAALIYTAVVLLTALLAKGSARGREGVVRALLGGGILLAPSLVLGTRVLMQGPDHLGTAVPILLMLLVLDRARERWWVPVVVGVLLTLAQVSDVLATFAGAAAVALACGVRVFLDVVRCQRPLKSAGYDLSLGLAAVISIGLAHLILWGINAAGGFYMRPPKNGLGLAPISALPAHAGETVYNLLILFGADFFGQQTVVGVILALLHLTGVALALWGLLIGLSGFFGRAADRVTQVLVAGTVIILAAGIFGNYMSKIVGAHEIVTVLPFCAVLAGRLLGGGLVKARLVPVLAVGLACYLGALAYNDTQPVQAPLHADLADWLEAHHLTTGLAPYWESNITSLNSGGRVRLAPLKPGGASANPYESHSAWYNPAVSRANFVVTVSAPPSDASLVTPAQVHAQFGPPARTYHFKEYTVMVYDYNLLTRLQVPSLGGF